MTNETLTEEAFLLDLKQFTDTNKLKIVAHPTKMFCNVTGWTEEEKAGFYAWAKKLAEEPR